MDDPAAATDSSGVPSTIQKSPLDFTDEAEVSNQGTIALEMPPSEDVPATNAPGQARLKKLLRRILLRPQRAMPYVHNTGLPKVLLQQETRILRMPLPLSRSGLQKVAMGSHLRLRFEQEAKLLRKSVAQVARRDKIIQARELKIKNLEALLETKADMKKAAEDRSAGLIQELEDMRARFSDLQVSNERLSQQVATLQEQVSGEEKLKAAFEEFKWYEDDRVEQRCAELDARLDALSIDFDKELYPHMLTAITCRRRLQMSYPYGIAKGMSEGLRHGVEHGQAQLNVESIEAYDPEEEAKFVAAL
nr:hypothetical protein [Tanacetum cinerariifolium]